MDRIRILFVDDEAIVREGLKKCIDWEVNGFEVVGAAENGEKALAYLGQLSVNIVVTDIKMPVMDGLELIRNSRESGYDSKFLILSGYDDFQYAQRALRYGADDYTNQGGRTFRRVNTHQGFAFSQTADDTSTTSPKVLRNC